MSNEEINNALLAYRGYKQYVGNKDNLSPLMYFFLMDASYLLFRDVEQQEASGIQKKYKREIKEGYHLFFKNFFQAFNAEQIEFIIDKADTFEEYIKHYLNIAEIAVQECDNSKPIIIQKEMSRVWICNLLAADAQDFHGECWKTGRVTPLYDPYIGRVIKASEQYSKARFGNGPELNEKQFNRVQDAVTIIAKKTAGWIYKDYKKELGNK